jgi:hypothetical protein
LRRSRNDAARRKPNRGVLRADTKKSVVFGHALIRQDVNWTPDGNLYLPLAHTNWDVDRTIDIAEAVLWR